MSTPKTRRYSVETNMSDRESHLVQAAYFTHEDRFTVFKGEDGSIVASFANDHIVSIAIDQPVAQDQSAGSKLTDYLHTLRADVDLLLEARGTSATVKRI